MSELRDMAEANVVDGVTEDELAEALRNVGITPPPHSVNTGHILARYILSEIRSIRRERTVPQALGSTEVSIGSDHNESPLR